MKAVTPFALAAFFVVVQFYTSLAALSPTPPVGYVFAGKIAAACMVAVLALAAVFCAARLVRERAVPLPPSGALLLAWIGSTFLAGVLGYDPLSSLQVVAVMLLAGAFHLALVRYYPERGVAPVVFAAYLGAGALALAAALVMDLARVPLPLLVLNDGRAAGVFVTANQCAAFAIAFGFVAFGVALSATGRLRNLAVAGAALAALTLVATFSQAGALGAASGAIFFALAGGARRVALALGLAVVVVAVVVAARPVRGHDPSGTFDRLRTWRAGARVAELFALTGVGPMAYWRVYPAIRPPNGDAPGTFGALHPHDAYLSLAGETGVVGLVACGYGWLLVGRSVVGALAPKSRRERLLALGVCAGLVAVLVQGIFDTIGVVQLSFVWIPYTALALATARSGLPGPEAAMTPRSALSLALFSLATTAAGCSGAGHDQPSPSPSPSESASSAPAASPVAVTNLTGKHTPPITFEAPRTGDKYIYLTKQQRNRKVYVLRADAEKGEYFGENTGQSTFVNPHITFYGSDGKRLVADAPTGLVVERAKTVRMTGGVHALSQDGVRLTSDAMLYDGATETIHAQGNVVMDSPQGSELRGDTLDWNLHTGAVDVAGSR